MRTDEAVATDPAAVLEDVPPPRRTQQPVEADDHGAFRAVDPVAGTAVVLRPAAAGLEIHAAAGLRIVAWTEIRRVEIFDVTARAARVSAARITLATGAPLAIARMHTAGAGYLPLVLEPDAVPLMRVERMRLLTAAVIARAGLHATRDGVFERGPRLVPLRDITPRPRTLPPWAPPLLLLLSVLGLVFVFQLTPPVAAVVTLVLLVHEYGHVIAMRVLGLKVRGVLFLPLLGAATVPEQAFPSRWDEARVALAGPMTALPMALATVLLWHAGAISEALAESAFAWSLALNALNLVPLMPLDGGRALLALTAALRPRTRRVVQYAPVVLCAAALLVLARNAPGFAVGAFVVFSGAVTRIAFRRQDVHQWMEGAAIDLSALRAALRDVTHAANGVAREDVDGGVPPAPMTAAQAASVLVVYAVQVAAILGMYVAVHLPGVLGR